MNSRSVSRWMLPVVLASLMLSVSLLAVGQTQGRPLAMDYTVGGPCGSTVQACIDNPIVVNGDRILIPAGAYTESLTLNKAVSLIGADANTTIILAPTSQRALSIAGNTITSTTIISGLTFTGGHVGSYGGGIAVTGGARPTIQNSIIADNSAASGGGIWADMDSALTLVDTSVLSNTATYGSGGGVLAPSVTLVGGRFENNATTNYGSGGGIYALALSIVGTSFRSNTAHLQFGGGVCAINEATVIDGYFENNHAVEGSGGGLQANNLILINTTFVSNTAIPDIVGGYGWGGGASVGTAILVGNHFEGNEAQLGGGLFSSGVQTIFDTKFIGNVAHVGGGGLYSINDLTVARALFKENVAQNGGGVYQSSWYGLFPSAHISNAVLVRNVANENGAGLYLASSGKATLVNSTIADSTLNPGQAIAVSLSSAVGITNTIITSHSIGVNQIAGTVYQDYNLFFGNTTNITGVVSGGIHTIAGNPLFVDPDTDNYHITSGSPAIDVGINVGVYTDMDNEPRPHDSIDIGADEYWAPGALKHIYLPLVVRNQ